MMIYSNEDMTSGFDLPVFEKIEKAQN
jgi:hypothetical protein